MTQSLRMAKLCAKLMDSYAAGRMTRRQYLAKLWALHDMFPETGFDKTAMALDERYMSRKLSLDDRPLAFFLSTDTQNVAVSPKFVGQD